MAIGHRRVETPNGSETLIELRHTVGLRNR